MDLPQFKNIRFVVLLLSFVVLFLSSSWFLNLNFKKSVEESDWVNHTSQVISDLDAVLSGVLNAETGIRGFIVTGRTAYLEPYNAGILDTRNYVSRLKKRLGDNFSQAENLETLEQLIATAATDSSNVVQKRTFAPLNIQEIDALLLKNKQNLDNIRAQLEKMKNLEKSLLASRSEDLQVSRSFFFVSLIATTVLSLIFICFAFYQSKRSQDRAALDLVKKDAEARIRQDINLLSKNLAGDISLNQTAQAALEFIGIRMDVLASHLFFRDAGNLKTIASYGVASEDSTMGGKSLHSLVYEAFNRKELWQISEVPNDYWKIRSSLGEATPRQLTFLPIQFRDRTIAVIEMASFTKLSDYQLELLTRLAESVAIGLNTSQIRDRTIELLEESRQLAEELQVQQEELRASNEELEQQSRTLEEQQQTLLVRNREVDDARRQLEIKAGDLEKSSQYKSDFLAKMSHELRTPLNSLMILSTLLIENKERNLTAQQTQFARSIQNSGHDLLMLINDILDLSKIEARKLSLKADTFSIESLLAPKHNTFGVQARDKGLDFSIDLEGDAKTAVLNTDKQRVEQVLRNFISNAIKFTEKGSVKIKARLLEHNKLVEFSVSDTGIGIPQDKVDIIFEAFEQADSSVSRQFGGTGLGLTISRELAGLLGGRIRVRSEIGKGSEFSLIIPLQLKLSGEMQKADVSVVETPIITKTSPSYSAGAGEETSSDQISTSAYVRKTLDGLDKDKRNILIIEDDDTFRSSIVEAVKNYDFEAVEAPNSEVALALLEKMTPDAILLDIKLPGMSGLGLLEIVKRRSELRHVPVHMISGLEYQHSALRMGALGYLTKPVTIEKVNSALERIKNVISGNPRRVLLIEDDAIQSQAIRSLIAGTDVEVDSAESGKEAIQKLKADIYDCIILDLKLTDTSGFQLLSDLNGMDLSLPPVVIYTGKDLNADEESFLRKYSESIIIKGARSPERLLDEVNLFLHRVESLLPQDKREMLNQLRVHEQAYDGKTVLLVDDDLRNIFALTSALESKGLAVRVAKNGIEALEAVDRFSDIDLVLMDIMMPKMDGYETTRRIRQHSNSKVKNLPVIALTAKAMRGDHEKCIEAGASDYLPKPVNMENLSTVLKVWFSSKEV